MEGESEGETAGHRGFQGEPRLGFPLGRVIVQPTLRAKAILNTARERKVKE
jgi:hypothetical protein